MDTLDVDMPTHAYGTMVLTWRSESGVVMEKKDCSRDTVGETNARVLAFVALNRTGRAVEFTADCAGNMLQYARLCDRLATVGIKPAQ